MTDAAPRPIPPMTRQRIRVTGPPARPVPIALATNSRPAPTITLMRPYRFASCPAAQPPRAAPSSADATEKPVSPDPIEVLAQRGDSTVDDGGVEPEHEPAQGGN